jgi:hypothetical protein
MAWSAKFEGYSERTGDAGKQARFRFYRSGQGHTAFGVARSRTLEVELGLDDGAADAAMLRWAVRRMVQLVGAGDVPEVYTTDVDAVTLGSSDVDELRRLDAAKPSINGRRLLTSLAPRGLWFRHRERHCPARRGRRDVRARQNGGAAMLRV